MEIQPLITRLGETFRTRTKRKPISAEAPVMRQVEAIRTFAARPAFSAPNTRVVCSHDDVTLTAMLPASFLKSRSSA